MNVRSLLITLIIGSLILASILSAQVNVNGIVFYSPVPNEVFHYGQPLVLNISTGIPNATVTVYVDYGTTEIYFNNYQANAQGNLAVTLFTFGSGAASKPGTYTVLVDVNSGVKSAAVTVKYLPAIATIIVDVTNGETGLPFAGVNVTLYNITSGVMQYIASQTTNVNGQVQFSVVSFNFTQTFKVVASYPGYVSTSAQVSIVGNETETVSLTLYPAVLTIMPVEVIQNGTAIDSHNPVGYSSVVVVEGLPASMLVQVMFAGKPITNATLYVSTTSSEFQNLHYSLITTGPFAGYYNVSFLPQVNSLFPAYTGVINITAVYSGLTKTVFVTVTANYPTSVVINSLNGSILKLEAEFNQLATEISNLETEVQSINSTLSSITSQINTLNNEINTINGQIGSLNSNIPSLEHSISSLNSTVNSLSSELNSIKPLVYGGIIAGIIGLIVAIVAIVLVYRKIS
jgi:5-hydroxyisourate hydrolase-like protein (transthyretin family)/chaperonin cofactor prefoldin